MSLKNMTLKTGCTISAPSGGTDIEFVDDGVQVQSGIHLVVSEDTDITSRRQLTIKNRAPVFDTKSQRWSKDKKSMSFSVPYHVDGVTYFNTIRIEREMAAAATSEEKAEFNKIAAQLLTDGATSAFWTVGSLS